MERERSAAIDAGALAWCGVALAYGVAVAWTAPARYFPRVMVDDASYYLTIARNAAAGFGFTFDRLNPTNGFQPLWQWLLVLLARLVPGSDGLVRATWIVESLLLVAAALFLWRKVREVSGSGPAAVAAILLLHNGWYLGHSGMESALVMLMAAVVLSARRPDSLLAAGGFGLTLALLTFSRLDSGFWVLASLGALALSGKSDETRRQRLWSAVVAGAVWSIALALYLSYNLARFGHWMPISGVIKSSFPQPGWHVASFSIWGREINLFVQSSLLAAGFLIVRCTRLANRWPLFWRVEMVALAAGTLAQQVFAALFMKWAVFGWHFALSYVFVALMAAFLAERMLSVLGPARRILGWAALGALLIYGTARDVLRTDRREPERRAWTVVSWEAALWVESHLPADAILAMTDSGNMGFYSGRRVVDLDGIVNSWDYQEALRVRGLREFLSREGVVYYAQHAFWNDPRITEGRYDTYTFTAYSHLYDQTGGSLTLRRADEIYRSPPYWDGPHRTALVIWRIPPR